MDNSNNHPLGWTTVEEAKQLVKAGLPVETADMHYFNYGIDYGSNEFKALTFPYVDTSPKVRPYVIPCWSLGALINLLPEVFMDDIRCYPVIRKPIYTGQWQIAYVNGLYETLHYERSVEAVIELIIWLLKNKKL